MLPISDDKAQAFAEALIAHAGNQTKAAIALGYKPGPYARECGLNLARNPKVLRILQPLAYAQLNALSPKAIQALSALLGHKSGYLRLEAAKDILNRNGVGATPEQTRAPPLIVRINIGQQPHISDISVTQSFQGLTETQPDLLAQSKQIDARPEGHPPNQLDPSDVGQDGQRDGGSMPDLSLDTPTDLYARSYAKRPGGPKLEVPDFATSLPRDFSEKGSSASGAGLGGLGAGEVGEVLDGGSV